MFATSQLTAAVVLQYEGYFLGCNRKTSWVGRMLMPSIVYTSLEHPYGNSARQISGWVHRRLSGGTADGVLRC